MAAEGKRPRRLDPAQVTPPPTESGASDRPRSTRSGAPRQAAANRRPDPAQPSADRPRRRLRPDSAQPTTSGAPTAPETTTGPVPRPVTPPRRTRRLQPPSTQAPAPAPAPTEETPAATTGGPRRRPGSVPTTQAGQRPRRLNPATGAPPAAEPAPDRPRLRTDAAAASQPEEVAPTRPTGRRTARPSQPGRQRRLAPEPTTPPAHQADPPPADSAEITAVRPRSRRPGPAEAGHRPARARRPETRRQADAPTASDEVAAAAAEREPSRRPPRGRRLGTEATAVPTPELLTPGEPDFDRPVHLPAVFGELAELSDDDTSPHLTGTVLPPWSAVSATTAVEPDELEEEETADADEPSADADSAQNLAEPVARQRGSRRPSTHSGRRLAADPTVTTGS
ncbi:MAG: hypothetical protein LBL92_04165, partial [Propionibacteriaceae bacterium]|nr:hypothetical protein [Propionibacteriaceae bacterium]